jgi:hypothetical protein
MANRSGVLSGRPPTNEASTQAKESMAVNPRTAYSIVRREGPDRAARTRMWAALEEGEAPVRSRCEKERDGTLVCDAPATATRGAAGRMQ